MKKQEKKEIWFYIDGETEVNCLTKAYNLNYSLFYITYSSIQLIEKVALPRGKKLAVQVNSQKELDKLYSDKQTMNRLDALFVTDKKLLSRLSNAEKMKVGLSMNVKDKESLHYVIDCAKDFNFLDFISIEFSDPTNIPLELILAETQMSKTRIIKKVNTATDGSVSFQTMEEGAQIIMLASRSLDEIVNLDNNFNKAMNIKIKLSAGKVTNISHTGMGERVCIDTTSMLSMDEGIILGSVSNGGIVTCSETHYLPYMDLRPFRVNAGGIHLYVWGPDNKTYYLSDLRAGNEVLVVNSEGDSRIVTVGRLKIERRPLLCIEAEVDGKKINTFIQDDWHVRLMGSKGEIRPSSEIQIGEELLVYLDDPGRHVGIKIDETINEV